LVTVDSWEPTGNGKAELILTGKQVGKTTMLISDSVSSQQVTLAINIIACNTLTSNDVTRNLLAIVNVGQSLDFTIIEGNGIHSISTMPNNNLVNLTNWQPHNDGSANFTLTGIKAGNTKFQATDSTNQEITVIITVIEPRSVTRTQGLNFVGNSTGELQVCDDALQINTQTSSSFNQACFTSRISVNGISQPNHQSLTNKEARNLRVSALVKVAPEHVGKAAEIVLVGMYNTLTNKKTQYTRNEQIWRVWDEQIGDLTTAQSHPQLPELVDIFIFEGDLSAMPGEFTVFVGYRLLDDTVVIYNGLQPIHFFVMAP